MIEIFKTNVTETTTARMLTELIDAHWDGYRASFDLEDCDKVLRIESKNGVVQSSFIIELLKKMNFCAEVLPEENPATMRKPIHKRKYDPMIQ